MFDRIKAISLRWKIQIFFFTVTLITTLYNRILGAAQMKAQINLVKEKSTSAELISAMQAQYQDFMWLSIWETSAQLIIQFFIIMALAHVFVRPILLLTGALKATSKGDFTQSVREHSQDEIGVLETCFNDVLKTLNRVISHVHTSSLHTTQSAYQIASVTQEIERSSHLEAQRSKEVNEATESLHRVSNQVIASAKSTREQAQDSANSSKEGIELVQEVISDMNAISSSIQDAASQTEIVKSAVESIGCALQEITSIADQTNLLALNAAIEAARAGENGRGFAVVADEVRALSVRTSDSAGSVRGIIDQLNKDMQQSHNLMFRLVESVEANQAKSEHTRQLMGDIQSSISNFVDASEHIYGKTTQQLQEFSHLENRLTGLFQALKQNSIKLGNTANIGQSLFTLTQKMEAELSGLQFIPENSDDNVPKDIAERRSKPRAPGYLLVQVKPNMESESQEGLSTDISEAGIRIATQADFEKGNFIYISIKPPSASLPDYVSQEPVSLKAEVMWKRTGTKSSYLYGLRFVDLDAKRQAEIQRCCNYYTPTQTINHKSA